MATCPKCGHGFDCNCGPRRQLGSAVLPCPLQEGALWVHVTDDEGKDLNGVEVSVHGGATRKTEKGVATFERLEPVEHVVSLSTVPDTILEKHDLPVGRTDKAWVVKGEIAYVPFELPRKALLKVKVVKQGERTRVFSGATVEATGAKGGPEKRPTQGAGQDVFADFGWQSAGVYPIGLTLNDPDGKAFIRNQVNLQVQLSAGDQEIVYVEVEARPKLKVKVFAADPAHLCKDAVVEIGGGYPSQKTVDGIADFGPVEVGEYELKVQLSDDEARTYDTRLDFTQITAKVRLKMGDEVVVDVEVEPTYKTVRFIGHCLVTVPKQLYVRGAGENAGDYQNARRDWPALNRKTFYELDPDEINDQRRRKRADLRQNPAYQEVAEKLRTNTITDVQEVAYVDGVILEERSIVAGKLHGEGQMAPTGAWKAQYNGLAGTEKANVEALAKFVGGVIGEAAKKFAEKNDELKVCMLPEAFFLGNKGAYAVETVDALIEELQKVVMARKWRHWVFAMGTVNGISPDPDDDKALSMFNMAPVIRGGSVDLAQAPDHTWVIQKATFCQEIPGAGDLVGGGHTEESAGFQFGSTETEYKLGTIVRQVATTNVTVGGVSVGELFVAQKLTAAHWAVLKATVASSIEARGIYAVVRDIRKFQRAGYDTGTFADTHLWGLNVSGRTDEYGKRDMTPIAEGWKSVSRLMLTKHLRGNSLTWKGKPKPEKLTALSNVIDECRGLRVQAQPVVRGIELQGITLATELAGVVAALNLDDGALFDQICDAKPVNAFIPGSTWDLGWTLTFKRLLKLYLQERGQESLLEARLAESYRFEDYSFSSRRVAGPWLPDRSLTPSRPPLRKLLRWEGAGPWTWDKDAPPGATTAEPSRKLTFGLEICADHSEMRLAKSMKSWAAANTGSTLPPVDIQLVPSAGMTIAHDKIVARDGGCAFNCDGWNVRGAGAARKMRDRGAPVLEVLMDDAPDDPGHNPLSPHSELLQSSGPGNAAATIRPEVAPVSLAALVVPGLTPDDQAKLFANGPGELHIYPPRPLVNS